MVFNDRDRLVVGAALLIAIALLVGFSGWCTPQLKQIYYSQRTPCAQGCQSTGCKRNVCGDTGDKSCRVANCKGCWKKAKEGN